MSDGAPLFTLDGACIESGGVVTAALSGSGGDARVALLGPASPIFRYLRGEARLVSGSVRVAGRDAREALRSGRLAVASQELPASVWTVAQHLEASARFAVLGKRSARRLVERTLARLGVSAPLGRRLHELDVPLRRALSLVRAALGEPEVICAEAPLVDLDPASDALVGGVLTRLLDERRLVVSFPAAPLDGTGKALLERADFTLELPKGDGSPAADKGHHELTA